MLWSKLSAAVLMQLLLSPFLGLALIPLFRRLRTGIYEPIIGDRMKTDGSEPAFGGAVMWIVFAFGIVIAAVFDEAPSRLFAVLIYTLIVTSAGAADDYMTDVLHKPYGVKSVIKPGLCYAASLVYMLIMHARGSVGSALVLPFGMGMLDLQKAYCPVMAAVMTLIIYSFRTLDRFGTDDSTYVGGLGYAVSFVCSLGFTLMGSASGSGTLVSYGCVSAAAAMGAMFWGLSPSKQRSGSSGAFLTGALCAAAAGLIDFYGAAVLISSLAALTDGICSALQMSVYRSRKRLLLKGSSLHAHLTAKGRNEYAVIMIFSLISAVGAAAAAGLVFYGENKYF